MIKKEIPREKYKEMLDSLPICCVDVVIHYNKKILLIYRGDEPCKNQWWTIGGRIFKNEKMEDAAIRKALEEAGINIKIKKRIGMFEFFSDKGPFTDLNSGVHTVSATFLAEPADESFNVLIDETSLDYKWIDKIEKDLNPILKKILKDSGVFN